LTNTLTDKPTAGYLPLLRANPNFRNLWLGQIVSLLGDWFNLIASAALITQLSGSGSAIGALFIIRMLAPFLISPLAGVWADRYDRRKLLILSDLLRGFTLFAFLLVREPQHIWLLYSLTAFQLAVSGIFYPTRSAMLPDIVSEKEIGAANALTSATWSVMLALGAALGGLSAGLYGIYPSFIIDAATFFLSAYFIYLVQYQPPSVAAVTSFSAALNQYLDGLRYLAKHTAVLFTTLLKPAAALIISGCFQVIQVIIAEQVYPIGEGGALSLGILYTAVGVGTGLGPILSRLITRDSPRRLRIAIMLSYGIAASGFALISTFSSFPVVIAGALLRGFGVGINWVFSTQLLYQLLPAHIRGRVFSTEFALLTLMNAAGSALGGWLLDTGAVTLPSLVGGLALVTLLPGILWGLWVFFGRHPAPLSTPASPD